MTKSTKGWIFYGLGLLAWLITVISMWGCTVGPTPIVRPPIVVPPPVVQHAVVPRLVPLDNRFLTEHGDEIRLIGINSHQLRDRFVHDQPGYEAHVEKLLDEHVNVYRVFSMCNREVEPGSVWWTSGQRFVPCPSDYDDAYYASWPALAQDLGDRGARHGLHVYLHIDVFACARDLMPDAARWPEHWRRMQAAVRGLTNVILTPGNELDNGCNGIETTDFPSEDGLLTTAGSNTGRSVPPRPWRQIEEYHSNQSPEPQRESHNAMEFNQGDPEGHFAASRVPIIISEMPRPDQMRGLYKYFDSGRAGELLIAASYYHCDRCRFSGVLEGEDLDGLRQFVAGAESMPLYCKAAGAYHHSAADIAHEIANGLLKFYGRGDDPACTVEIRR